MVLRPCIPALEDLIPVPKAWSLTTRAVSRWAQGSHEVPGKPVAYGLPSLVNSGLLSISHGLLPMNDGLISINDGILWGMFDLLFLGNLALPSS